MLAHFATDHALLVPLKTLLAQSAKPKETSVLLVLRNLALFTPSLLALCARENATLWVLSLLTSVALAMAKEALELLDLVNSAAFTTKDLVDFAVAEATNKD